MNPTMAVLTFDCTDAARTAAFWAAVLGWDVAPDPTPDFALVGGPRRPRDTPSLMFVRVPEGKSAKNRLHLDLEAADLTAEEARLTALGAAVLHRKEEHGERWVTFGDPEGNEFCVSRPHQVTG